MEDAFGFVDDLGPEKVVQLYDPGTGMRAVVVVDNVATGPSIGGVRMAPDVSVEECLRLARAMTLKNAAAGLPHGGGKSVIFADPKMASDRKEGVVRAFAHGIAELTDYIPGPDMGTDETCMAWVRDETGRAVGLPREVGGIPLDEVGATGFGLLVAIDAAREFSDLEIHDARVAIQGFGSVGMHAARFLQQKGAILVAAADSRGTVVDPDGLDVDALLALKEQGGSVLDHPRGQKRDREAVIDVACDIWIPAARPDVLTKENVDRLDARVVAEGANIPATREAEEALHRRGVLVLPDFIANAGGVLCAAVEYHGGTQGAAFDTIAEKIGANTRAVLRRTSPEVTPRRAALALAEERVRTAMGFRRAF